MNRGQGREYFIFSGASFSLNYFLFFFMLDILMAMGIIKSHHFVLDKFIIFCLGAFFLFKQKNILFKINSKLVVVRVTN